MIATLRNLIRRQPEPEPGPVAAIPPGERVYALGDIHGRLDLLTPLIAAIEADDGARGSTETTVVLLGDLVDRGPDSAGVIAAVRRWSETQRIVVLAGNHEEMLLRAHEDGAQMDAFLRYGGFETLVSYGVDPTVLAHADPAVAWHLMRAAVPETDLQFLRDLPNTVVIGDYLFVHAGIRPGMPLDSQHSDDLRWIREPFLSHSGDHGYVVVHGHTIGEDADIRPNRIGIDTGAYRTGRLTALALEGTARWLIEVDEAGVRSRAI